MLYFALRKFKFKLARRKDRNENEILASGPNLWVISKNVTYYFENYLHMTKINVKFWYFHKSYCIIHRKVETS